MSVRSLWRWLHTGAEPGAPAVPAREGRGSAPAAARSGAPKRNPLADPRYAAAGEEFELRGWARAAVGIYS